MCPACRQEGERKLTDVEIDRWHLWGLILKEESDNPGATQPAARGLLNPNTSLHCQKKILISLYSTRIKYEQRARNQGQVRFWVPRMHLEQINCHIDWLSPELHLCPVSTVKEDNCYEGSWETEALLTAGPWLVKRGQLRTWTQQRWRPFERHLSLFKGARYQQRIQKGKKRRKLVMEICLCKCTHVIALSVFFMTFLYQDPLFVSVLILDAQKRIFKMSLSTMLFLRGCLFRLKCHCLCLFSWCLCWTLHTWIGLSKINKQIK